MAEITYCARRSSGWSSTLADANEGRDWHIWEALAMIHIRRARKLYTKSC